MFDVWTDTDLEVMTHDERSIVLAMYVMLLSDLGKVDRCHPKVSYTFEYLRTYFRNTW